MAIIPTTKLEEFENEVDRLWRRTDETFPTTTERHNFHETAQALIEIAQQAQTLMAWAEYGAEMMALCNRKFSEREARNVMQEMQTLLERVNGK